jgi:hypothetical protein
MFYMLCDLEFWFQVREMFITLSICYLVLRA